MAMTMQERKQAQRSRPDGYAKSRRTAWTSQGIDPTFTFQQFEDRIETQHHECAICHRPIDARCALDHSHRTGAARGVLCSNCNLLLGRVEGGSLDFFLNAAAYLRKYESVSYLPSTRRSSPPARHQTRRFLPDAPGQGRSHHASTRPENRKGNDTSGHGLGQHDHLQRLLRHANTGKR